jgi:sugar phosphate permease
MALLFYFLEYATRSAPGMMMPQLEQAFGRTSVGVSSILGNYYSTDSLTSLVAGLAHERAGTKYVVPFGSSHWHSRWTDAQSGRRFVRG